MCFFLPFFVFFVSSKIVIGENHDTNSLVLKEVNKNVALVAAYYIWKTKHLFPSPEAICSFVDDF